MIPGLFPFSAARRKAGGFVPMPINAPFSLQKTSMVYYEGQNACLTPDNFLVTYNDVGAGQDGWIGFYDSDLNPVVKKRYKDSSGSYREGEALAADADAIYVLNTMIVSGNGSPAIVSVSLDGTTVNWAKTYTAGSHLGSGRFVINADDPDYLYAFWSYNADSGLGSIHKISKADGSVIWAKKFSAFYPSASLSVIPGDGCVLASIDGILKMSDDGSTIQWQYKPATFDITGQGTVTPSSPHLRTYYNVNRGELWGLAAAGSSGGYTFFLIDPATGAISNIKWFTISGGSNRPTSLDETQQFVVNDAGIACMAGFSNQPALVVFAFDTANISDKKLSYKEVYPDTPNRITVLTDGTNFLSIWAKFGSPHALMAQGSTDDGVFSGATDESANISNAALGTSYTVSTQSYTLSNLTPSTTSPTITIDSGTAFTFTTW